MGIFSTFTGIKNDLFGKDSESDVTTGPSSGTKTTKDSGQSGSSSTVNSGSVNSSTGTGTTQTSGSQVSSGSTNSSQNSAQNSAQNTAQNTFNSGSTNTSTTSGSKDTFGTAGSRNVTSTGPSSSVTTTDESINTSQLLIDQKGVDRMVSSILEGSSGLASLSQGNAAGGGYNSSVKTLLANDLISRTVGEISARTGVTKNVIGATRSVTNNSGSVTTQDIGATSGFTNRGGSTTTEQIGSSSSSTLGASIGATIGSSTGVQNNTNTTNTNSTQNQNTTGTNVIGGSTSNTNTNSGPRTIEELVSSSGSKTSQDNNDKGLLDWIVCTELKKQGRMSTRDYVAGGKRFLQYDDRILRGYYIWAVPATKHLREYPDSQFSALLEHVFVARARYMSGRKTFYNTLVSAAVHALCWTLSRTIAADFKYSRDEVYHVR